MNMPHWLAVSYCYFKGHRRGRRAHTEEVDGATRVSYTCPRCDATWMRKLPKGKQ